MKATVLRPVTRGIERHPRRAVSIPLFALRHPKALLVVTRVTRRATRSAETARRVAGNRKVQKETRLALSAIGLASQRARKVGLSRASRDRRLAAHLRHAGMHASKAMTFAQRASRRRHNVRTTATVAIGAGALGGAAYAGWKAQGRTEPEPAVESTAN